MSERTPAITSLAEGGRSYAPDPRFAAAANVDAAFVDAGRVDPLAFWAREAERLQWDEPWHTLHEWRPTDAAASTVPEATWFAGGRLNVAVNCVDRHVASGDGEKIAFHFEGERGDRRSITYAELEAEVARAANALVALGVGVGDRVVIYLPVLIETIVATLAVARIGAVHSLVFGGFSAEALRFRVADTGARLLITSDGQFRRGRSVAVKPAADEAVAGLEHVEHVLVVRRVGEEVGEIPWTPGRDVWWHDALAAASDRHVAESFDAENPLFIIYTSGTTGRPKGLVHTSGGYLTHVTSTFRSVFDAKPDDVYWCTADLAWVTAHSYVLYGPLANGVTSVIYEGTPDTPHPGRHFEIIERHRVSTYYTAPTLIRSFMSWYRAGVPAEYDRSSLRLLGSVGEAINPAAWEWFRAELGGGTAPIVDTWWQSETGGAVMAPLPGLSTLKPGSALGALPGLRTRVVDERGDDVARGEGGYLVIDGTWPGMARTVWSDPGATSTPTGRGSPTVGTSSRATARRSTPTATSGCSAESTTSSTCPATASRPSRSSRRSWRTPTSPRRASSASPTSAPAKPSRRSSSPAAPRVEPTRPPTPPGAPKSSARTWRPRSAPSRSPVTSSSSPSCRRRARARSCAACSWTSPSDAPSAT